MKDSQSNVTRTGNVIQDHDEWGEPLERGKERMRAGAPRKQRLTESDLENLKATVTSALNGVWGQR